MDLVKIWCVKTLAKGVSGLDLGGPPFWQIDPLSDPGGECFAPLWDSETLRLWDLWESEILRFLTLRFWNSKILRLFEILRLWDS